MARVLTSISLGTLGTLGTTQKSEMENVFLFFTTSQLKIGWVSVLLCLSNYKMLFYCFSCLKWVNSISNNYLLFFVLFRVLSAL